MVDNAMLHQEPVQADPLLPDPAELARLGNPPEDYRHLAKQVDPADGLALPGGYLKWYDVYPPDDVIPLETRDQARDYLRGEASTSGLDLAGELGFVVLHRCAGEVYFLIVCTWRNANEMWQTAYRRVGDEAFGPVPREPGHLPTQCVWELAATSHERLAWSRYLRSDRDEPAKRAYLADQYTGEA
ncbi:MAG TPA: hypothetical protein VHV49_15530 [Pseudonocardiaceae bacterium]|jgi:hypothetical protein|nr:hypothetical protein [Pseudonocardiaceae bacterium]